MKYKRKNKETIREKRSLPPQVLYPWHPLWDLPLDLDILPPCCLKPLVCDPGPLGRVSDESPNPCLDPGSSAGLSPAVLHRPPQSSGGASSTQRLGLPPSHLDPPYSDLPSLPPWTGICQGPRICLGVKQTHGGEGVARFSFPGLRWLIALGNSLCFPICSRVPCACPLSPDRSPPWGQSQCLFSAWLPDTPPLPPLPLQ